ncbi:unnamed protein product [Ilex paraguariensis]|uniref:Phospholipase D n=1 Tax=Ilex paraguariensis TaxID=185542 RepID=A0ABC8TS14_9AQUA
MPKPGGEIILGELLKKKADKGVNVLMLVWDDRTSVEALKKDGLMATHDKETGDFVQKTKVHCVLCPRNPDDGESIFQGLKDLETWNVQIFQSIDGGAVSGFPEKPVAAAAVGLVNGKDNIIDRSIQDAYIHAIRRAKNFIYIKNQYFVGSSYNWKSDDIKVEDIGALHLIPKELSLKIVSKIEAGERFTVYIVIPMWPEGIPMSGSVQAILDWQKRTMEMMYTDIAQALSAKGLTANLRDCLTFFFASGIVRAKRWENTQL